MQQTLGFDQNARGLFGSALQQLKSRLPEIVRETVVNEGKSQIVVQHRSFNRNESYVLDNFNVALNDVSTDSIAVGVQPSSHNDAQYTMHNLTLV